MAKIENTTTFDSVPPTVRALSKLATFSLYARDGMIVRTESRQGYKMVTHLMLDVPSGDGYAELRINGELFGEVAFPGGGAHGVKCKRVVRAMHYAMQRGFDRNLVKRVRKVLAKRALEKPESKLGGAK